MKKIVTLVLLFNLLFNNAVLFAQELAPIQKHPCYHRIFLDEDKYEKFNRKVFNFNLKMNKIFVKKIHVLWASLFPDFVITESIAISNILKGL